MAGSNNKTIVTSDKVSCNGGGGSKGHPNVYLVFQPGDKSLECPYCGHEFVKSA